MSGTSMATPEVAGAAALRPRRRTRRYTPLAGPRERCMAGADPLSTALAGKVASGGRLDVFNADERRSAATPAARPTPVEPPTRRSRASSPRRRDHDARAPRAVPQRRPSSSATATPAAPTPAADARPDADAGGTRADHAGVDRTAPTRRRRARGPRRPELLLAGRAAGRDERLRARDRPRRAAPRRAHRQEAPPHDALVRRSSSPPARATLTKAGTKAVTVRLTAKAKRALARLRSVKVDAARHGDRRRRQRPHAHPRADDHPLTRARASVRAWASPATGSRPSATPAARSPRPGSTTRPELLRRTGFPRRPRIEPDDRLVLYASVWRRVFAVVQVVGGPEPREHPRWPWTVATEPLLVVPGARRGAAGRGDRRRRALDEPAVAHPPAGRALRPGGRGARVGRGALSRARPAARAREACAQVSPRPREIAISPVRIISMSPNGRTMRSKASIFSVVPVTSMMIERLRDVDDLAAEDLADLHDLRALRAVGGDLEERELAGDRVARLEVADLQDVDELVQLLGDLVDRVQRAVDGQRDAREALVVGRPDRERVDVEPAPREQARRCGSGRPACSRRGSRGRACGPVRSPPAASSSSRLSSSLVPGSPMTLTPPCPARPGRARSSGTRSPRA